MEATYKRAAAGHQLAKGAETFMWPAPPTQEVQAQKSQPCTIQKVFFMNAVKLNEGLALFHWFHLYPYTSLTLSINRF